MGAKITKESILELARSFMASRVLLSGAELDLFSLLAKEPLTAKKIAVASKTLTRKLSASI